MLTQTTWRRASGSRDAVNIPSTSSSPDTVGVSTSSTANTRSTLQTSRSWSALGALNILFQADKPLTTVGVVMAVLLIPSLAGLALDPRLVTGAPVWLKPAKFAASTAIYALTLAWIFTWLAEWRRVRAIAGWTTAVVFVVEVAIIDIQAWRGTSSHFNVSTPLNAVLFTTMGIGILVQTLASVAVVVALWRQHFADPVIGWALRAGMTVTLIGAMTGGLMTQPTAAQLAAARQTGQIAVAGAHTVGAPDGGPGIAGTGWSREHGDLRVPHFVGLHAVQALMIAAVILRRSRNRRAAAPRMLAIAASYLTLFGLLLWQALRGESVVAPTAVTLAAIAGWFALSATVFRLASAFAASTDPRLIGAHGGLVDGLRSRRDASGLGSGDNRVTR